MEKQEVPNKGNALQKARGREVILFDGVCNLCNGAIDFILERDPEGHFVFASLQSVPGREILSQFGLATKDFDSVVLVKNGRVYKKSRAAIEIASKMTGGWPLFQIFKVIPRFVTDGVYNFIAQNRYKFFGKRETCRLPTPAIRSRFLEEI